jgi:ABC-type transport system substrate-binding protein
MSVLKNRLQHLYSIFLALAVLALVGCGGESAEEADTSVQDAQTDSTVDMTLDTPTDSIADFEPSDMVDPNTGRISGNLVALYLFNEDQSQFVYDRSNDGHPIDLFNRIERLGSRLVDRTAILLTTAAGRPAD